MNNPGEIVIAFFELLEAEIREIKGSLHESINFKKGTLGRLLMRLAGCVTLVLAAIFLVLVALSMMLWSMYLTMNQFMNPAPAALLTGFATLAAAALLIIIARWLNR